MENDPVGVNVIVHPPKRIGNGINRYVNCIHNQTLRQLFTPTVSFCMDVIIIFIDIYFGESDKLYFVVVVVFMRILGLVWLFILLSFPFVMVVTFFLISFVFFFRFIGMCSSVWYGVIFICVCLCECECCLSV